MTTQQIGTGTMIERSTVETVLARVAVAAFQYYPLKSTEELGWTVEEDVDWALAPLRSLPGARSEEWRQRVRDVIVNQASDRRAFTAALMALAEDRD